MPWGKIYRDMFSGFEVMVVHVVVFWLVTPCNIRIQIIRNGTSSADQSGGAV